jgi:hypothetical protein
VGLALLFVGDSMFALGVSEHSRTTGIWDTVLLAAAVFIGVAALDPTMRALTEEKGDPAELVDRRRFPLIAGVAVVPPAILAIQALRGEPLHVAANVIASLLLVGLLAMRGWFTTSNALQSAQREAMLSRFTSEILSAAGEREELFAATRRALDAFALAEGSEASLVIGSDLELAGIDAAFVAPVMLKGECVAVVVADARPSRLRRWRDRQSALDRAGAGAAPGDRTRGRRVARRAERPAARARHPQGPLRQLRVARAADSAHLDGRLPRDPP